MVEIRNGIDLCGGKFLRSKQNHKNPAHRKRKRRGESNIRKGLREILLKKNYKEYQLHTLRFKLEREK